MIDSLAVLQSVVKDIDKTFDKDPLIRRVCKMVLEEYKVALNKAEKKRIQELIKNNEPSHKWDL